MARDPEDVRTRFNPIVDGNPLLNKLLLNLPNRECERICAQLTFLPLRAHDVLSETGLPIKYGYFMNSGLVSILNVMENGNSVEVGLAGREGFVGVPLLVGFESSPSRVTVEIEASGFRIPAMSLVRLLADCPILENRLQRYVQVVGLQSAQLAGCNRLHQVEQRLARWLLMCQDRVQLTFVPLTQDSLAHLLGTRRSSITMAAGVLQKAGLIAHTPGSITIINRAGLEEVACECYAAVADQSSKWNQESA